MTISLLILAAGLGSRFGGTKQLEPIGKQGETLLDYAIFDAKRAGFSKVVIVIRKKLETIFRKNILPKYKNTIDVKLVFQEIDIIPKDLPKPSNTREKPWGTGHAVWIAKTHIQTPFAVINADDFYGADSYKLLAKHLINKKNPYSMVSFQLDKTLSKNGGVSRGICQKGKKNQLLNIIEHTNITYINNHISGVSNNHKVLLDKNDITSLNLFGLDVNFFDFIEREFIQFYLNNSHSIDAEFMLPSEISKLISEKKIIMKVLPTYENWLGMTFKEDKEWVIREIQNKTIQNIYPKELFP